MINKRSALALLVMIAFVTAIVAAAWPLSAGSNEGEGSYPGGVDSSTGGKEEPAGAFEKESPPESSLHKKKFPWILVAAGAVAAGVIVYFTLVKKPEYKLTVAKGEGVEGDLANGVSKYKKGKEIPYRFTLKTGYKNLTVLLDGQPVASEGSVKMRDNHYLQAMAEEMTCSLSVAVGAGVKGTPASGVYSYKFGQVVTYGYTADSGYTNLQVKLDGIAVPASGSLTMDKDRRLEATADKGITPPAPWDEAYNEEGTWQMVEQSTSGGPKVSTIIIRRNPDHWWDGYVEMEHGAYFETWKGTYKYERIVDEANRSVKITWVTYGSDVSIFTYRGTFTNERTITGIFLDTRWETIPSGPPISTWTMTKISNETSRR